MEKIFCNDILESEEHASGSMMKNEIYSFQLAGWVSHESQQRVHCTIRVESELEPYIQIKRVGYVPSLLPAIEMKSDDDYISKQVGMFPDPLFSVTDGKIELASNQTRAFWFVVEPRGEIVGTFPIGIEILDEHGEILDNLCFELEIIDANLPALDIYNTGWFHGDCIAKLHNVELLSDTYFSIVEKYLEIYVKFGHNTILTPIFTPPLDTEIGGERPTNQLVNVYVDSGEYTFEFGNLKRWIDLCHKQGITNFEMSHLFTQWGAYHAPKIMAIVDGEYKKIFGWETDALSLEYREFLAEFLPQLLEFLRSEDILQNCFFHVSDEPKDQHLEQYKAVKSILLSYLDDAQLIDALSSYQFFEQGIVTRPVVSTNHVHTFIEHGVKDLWAYYCVSQGIGVANRFMAMPSYRNRVLGYQLYKYDIKGFLHWGFNFWFSQYSKQEINPYVDTTAGGAFTSGDSFVVYPLDEMGDVVCSLRLYVLNEGFQDMRALKLLEQLTDKETVANLLREIEGFDSYPRNNQYYLEIRERINRKIKEVK